MFTKEFSVGEVIKKGWKAMRENLAFFIAFIIVGAILTFIPFGFAEYLKHRELYPVLRGIIYVVYYFISLMVILGFFKVALDISRGEKPEFKHLFTQFPKVWSFFLAGVIYNFLIFVGMLLLVFPAFYWGAKYWLFPFFIVDKNAGPIEALKLSSEATEGAKWDIVAFILVGLLILAAGVLALGVGTFAAMPTVYVGSAYAYGKLTRKNEVRTGPEFLAPFKDETLIADVNTKGNAE